MNRILFFLFPLICFTFSQCQTGSSENNNNSLNQKNTNTAHTSADTTIILDVIPFKEYNKQAVDYLYAQLKKIFTDVELKEPIDFPANAYYSPRNRYKADSLIQYLASITPKNHVSIGVTSRDISTSKNNFPDWGIMGLSYMPGVACVASTFRLNKSNLNEQFYKVAVHELGHAQGLDHCENKTCIMRDAEGKNTMDEEKDFCPNCKAYLKMKGWKIE